MMKVFIGFVAAFAVTAVLFTSSGASAMTGGAVKNYTKHMVEVEEFNATGHHLGTLGVRAGTIRNLRDETTRVEVQMNVPPHDDTWAQCGSKAARGGHISVLPVGDDKCRLQ